MCGGRDGHAERTVNLLGDFADLVLKRQFVLIEHVEVGFSFLKHGKHFFGQSLAAFAALGKDLGKRHTHAARRAVLTDEVHLFGSVGREGVDRDDCRHTKFLHVVQMCVQIADAALECREVGRVQFGLGYAAVVLERAHGCDDYDAVGRDTGLAALDIHELFRAEVGTKACFGNRNVG